MCTPITAAELALATSHYATLLGSGATGAVYSGAHRGAPLAVKLLAAPPDAPPSHLAALRSRFRAELLTLSSFRHPRIVTLLHACEDTGDAARPLALAFELLAGGSLADWLRGADGAASARGALSPLQRCDAALGIAHGLKYLHGLREPGEGGAQAPVVHRDVKSANVGFAMLGAAAAAGGGAGQELYAKLIDCGLAKALRGPAAAAGASFSAGVLGTPGYMAPELSNGTYTVASEVYSFGVVLLELLRGARVGPATASDAREGAEDEGVGHVAALADPCWPAPAAALLAALVVDCTHARPKRRPASLEPVVARLRELRALLAPGAAQECPVCLEEVAAASGVRCKGGGGGAHFCCRGCLQHHVAASVAQEALARHGGGVPCVAAGCAAPPWALEDLAPHLDAAALLAYATSMRYLALDLPRLLAERAAARAAREAALARIADAAERARQLRLVAVEEDLTLHCPRCRGAFLDWSGCAALQCRDEGAARRGCGAGFCALCLKDCGGDAHEHVRVAHARGAGGEGGDMGAYYFSAADYAAAHRGLRLAALAARLRALAGEPAVQEALLRALAGADLAGVGVGEGELRAAAGMGAAAGGGGEGGAQWACGHCTLVNEGGAARCGACEAERGSVDGGNGGGGAGGGDGGAGAQERLLPSEGMDAWCVIELMRVGAGDARVALEGVKLLRARAVAGTGEREACIAAGAVGALVAALAAHGAGDASLAMEGCWALANLSLQTSGRFACLEAGAVQAVAGALRAHAGAVLVANVACWTLGNLAEGGAGSRQALLGAGAVPLLVSAAATFARREGGGLARKHALAALDSLGYTEAGVLKT